jgi:hypothetical protein
MSKVIVFTDEVILESYKSNERNAAATAKALTKAHGVPINAGAVRYRIGKLKDVPEADLLHFAKTEQQKRTAQVENNRLRRLTRDVLDSERTKAEVLAGISEAVKSLPELPMVKPAKFAKASKPMTVELLFSDLQIGKLMSDYDSQVAERRLIEYSEVAMSRINQAINNGYRVERILFCMIGDIIESDKKHANSARATDTGTAAQIEAAIRLISSLVVMPLAELGIPMTAICITGNHDHDDHGLVMFKSGKEQLSWPLYHSLRMIHNAYGHHHIEWKIPEGVFHIENIYGFHTLYEHGVGVAASETSMRKRLADRSAQVKQYLTMFRMGDKHHICRFNNDALVVNGAFFGDDREGMEYSGICGYDGYPAQLMFFHVPREDNFRLPIYDSLAIQLGHIK